jgi:5-(aminomethyl)-3-furanmethanol phosphate kinase
MTAGGIIVVKLGGSLLDLPGLGTRLRAWLDALPTRNVILVAGGGAMTDVIRTLDEVHRFGEEQAHWLAVRAMALNARVIAQLLPASRFVTALEDCEETWAADCTAIIDPVPVLLGDWGKPGELPHRWSVTSDSIAARIAELLNAQELLLLKSCATREDARWEDLARLGVVDEWFPQIAVRLPAVRVINFRRDA